jgi:hypothetical protein
MVLDKVFRDLSLGVRRSSQWRSVRKLYLLSHPYCECCGGIKGLEVHHIVAFHIDPSMELDMSNLLTLCEKNSCHLMWGHLGSFRSINKDVRKDVEAMKIKIRERP